MSELKPKGRFSLGNARQTAITAVIVIFALKIVLYTLIPLIPYLIGGVALFTILGIMLYRTNHF